MTTQPMTIRLAGERDTTALQWLAALDSAPPLTGRVLLAEIDGAPCAAVAIDSAAVIADPFERSELAVRVLLLRRGELTSDRRRNVPVRRRVRRLAPRPAC
jgi:hypothetical protein